MFFPLDILALDMRVKESKVESGALSSLHRGKPGSGKQAPDGISIIQRRVL